MGEILRQEFADTVNIHINRPGSLNALNLQMISAIDSHIKNLSKPLIFTGEGRAFCSGGDILAVIKSEYSLPFFLAEFQLFHKISSLPVPRIAILDGITMGGGVGLSMACSHRLLTNKTIWAMPETAIGFFPDVGASHFLHSLSSEELGLYLALTGTRMNGPDCYFAGISEFYVPVLEESMKTQIFELGVEGIRNLKKMPRYEDSAILKDMMMIQQCFDVNFDVGTIFAKLAGANNEWSRKVLGHLNEMCPLSLKITHESFKRGRNLSYLEALELEYKLCEKVTFRHVYNFEMSIRWKLIEKKKTRPDWRPETLAEISDGLVQSYFDDSNFRLMSHKL